MNVISPSISGLRPTTDSRRQFIRQLGLAGALFTVRGAFAEELARKTTTKTAWVEEGPFYPPKLPLDTDNDLLIVNDAITPAIGEITHLSGRILDTKGDPIRNAAVEIWSVDHDGVYLADRANQGKFDANFQGFGRFMTGSTGEYYFRTLKPVRYPGRQAPHIHFKIKRQGREAWTTQLSSRDFLATRRTAFSVLLAMRRQRSPSRWISRQAKVRRSENWPPISTS